MNFLIIIFLSGFALKAIGSALQRIWEVMKSGGASVQPRRDPALAPLNPMEYLRIRADNTKLRLLPTQVDRMDGIRLVTLLGPSDKKSA